MEKFSRHLFSLLLWPLILSFPASLLASDSQTPRDIEGARIISVTEAHQILTDQPRVFDLRNGRDYDKGHLPGATVMPYRDNSEQSANFDYSLDRFAIMQLPSDKGHPVIFYGTDPNDWPAYKAARIATMAGYSEVYWLRDGYSSWRQQGLPVEK